VRVHRALTVPPLVRAAPPEHLAQVADDEDGCDSKGGYEGCFGDPGQEVGAMLAEDKSRHG
jgi:hypothetical protein